MRYSLNKRLDAALKWLIWIFIFVLLMTGLAPGKIIAEDIYQTHEVKIQNVAGQGIYPATVRVKKLGYDGQSFERQTDYTTSTGGWVTLNAGTMPKEQEWWYDLEVTATGYNTWAGTLHFSWDNNSQVITLYSQNPPQPSQANTSLTVQINPANIPPGGGTHVTVSGRLTRADTGAGVAEKSIILNLPGVYVYSRTNSGGNYSYSYNTPNLVTGTHPVVARFEGDSSFNSSQAQTTLNVGLKDTSISITLSQSSVTSGTPTQIQITGKLIDSDTGAGIPDKQIELQWPNGKINVATGSNGDFSYSLTVTTSSNWVFQATFSGDTSYNMSSNQAVLTVGPPQPSALQASLAVSPSTEGDTSTQFTFNITIQGGTSPYTVYLRDRNNQNLVPPQSGSSPFTLTRTFSTPGTYYAHGFTTDADNTKTGTNEVSILVKQVEQENIFITQVQLNRVPAIASTASLLDFNTPGTFRLQAGGIDTKFLEETGESYMSLEGVYAYVTLKNPTSQDFSGKIKWILLDPNGIEVGSSTAPPGLLHKLKLGAGELTQKALLISAKARLKSLEPGLYRVKIILDGQTGDKPTLEEKQLDLQIVQPGSQVVSSSSGHVGKAFHILFGSAQNPEPPSWTIALPILQIAILFWEAAVGVHDPAALQILQVLAANEVSKTQPEPWLATADLTIDNLPTKDGAQQIRVRWWNKVIVYKDNLGDLYGYYARYDRAIIVVEIPNNIEIVDSGGAGLIKENKDYLVLSWIEDHADKGIDQRVDYPPGLQPKANGEYIIKIKQKDSETNSSVKIPIKASVSLALGPFENIISQSEPPVYNYTKWQTQPDETYWGLVGTCGMTKTIKLAPTSTVTDGEVYDLIDTYSQNKPSEQINGKVPTTEDIFEYLDRYFKKQ
jgi:hypothetical protein